MKSDAWSCHSCGVANRRGLTCCRSCSCPASATAKQIDAHRAAFVASGGSVLQAASSSLKPDVGGGEVLASLALLALGVWPVNRLARSPLAVFSVVLGTVSALVAMYAGPITEVSIVRAAAFAGGLTLVALGLWLGRLDSEPGRTVR